MDGQGVYKVAFCQADIVNPVVVDAGVERECSNHSRYAFYQAVATQKVERVTEKVERRKIFEAWELVLLVSILVLWVVIIVPLLLQWLK